jgi:hypothetical protein
MAAPPKRPTAPRTKKPYRAPTVKRYGTLKTLTQGKGGGRSDGMAPKTRMGMG